MLELHQLNIKTFCYIRRTVLKAPLYRLYYHEEICTMAFQKNLFVGLLGVLTLSGCAQPNTTEYYNPLRNETTYSLKGNQLSWGYAQILSFDLVSNGTYTGLMVHSNGALPANFHSNSLLVLNIYTKNGAQENVKLSPNLNARILEQGIQKDFFDFPEPNASEVTYLFPKKLLRKLALADRIHYMIETDRGIKEGDLNVQNLSAFREFYQKCSQHK